MRDSPRLVRIIVGGAITLCAMSICAFVAFLIWWKVEWAPKDRTSDWPKFYADEFAAYFWIPPEAKITQATSHIDMASRDFEVIFTLPETKSPATWIKEIAVKSNLGEYRQTDLHYDAGSDAPMPSGGRALSDHYLIRYDPISKTYEASVDAE